MSLRVWLPLKGDLTNNGAYNAAVTNTSATVDTNGKIGSCYRFNKNAYITIAKEAVSTIDSGECSFCLWLNINSFNAAWDTYVQFGLGTTPWVAYTMGLLRNSSSSNLVFPMGLLLHKTVIQRPMSPLGNGSILRAYINQVIV